MSFSSLSANTVFNSTTLASGPTPSYQKNYLDRIGVFLGTNEQGLLLSDDLWQVILSALTACVDLLVSAVLLWFAYSWNDIVISNVEPGIFTALESWTLKPLCFGGREGTNGSKQRRRRTLCIPATITALILIVWSFVVVPYISGAIPRIVVPQSKTIQLAKIVNIEALQVDGVNFDEWVTSADQLLFRKANVSLVDPPADALNYTYKDASAVPVDFVLLTSGFQVQWGRSAVNMTTNLAELNIANWTSSRACAADVFCISTDSNFTGGIYKAITADSTNLPQLQLTYSDFHTGIVSSTALINGQSTYAAAVSDRINIDFVKLQNYLDGTYVVLEFRYLDFYRSTRATTDFNTTVYATLLNALNLDYFPLTFPSNNASAWSTFYKQTQVGGWKDRRYVSPTTGTAVDQLCLAEFFPRAGDVDYHNMLRCTELRVRVVMSGVDAAAVGACSSASRTKNTTLVNWQYVDDPAPRCYTTAGTDPVPIGARRLASMHAESAPTAASVVDEDNYSFAQRATGYDRAAALALDLAPAASVLALLSKTGGAGAGAAAEPVTVVVGRIVVVLSWKALGLLAGFAAVLVVVRVVSGALVPKHFQDPWHVVLRKGVGAAGSGPGTVGRGKGKGGKEEDVYVPMSVEVDELKEELHVLLEGSRLVADDGTFMHVRP